jgi:hypothetical protein
MLPASEYWFSLSWSQLDPETVHMSAKQHGASQKAATMGISVLLYIRLQNYFNS